MESLNRLRAECGAPCRALSHDSEITTGAKIKSQMCTWLRDPGAPHQYF